MNANSFHLCEVVLLGVLAAAAQALREVVIALPPRRPLVHRHHLHMKSQREGSVHGKAISGSSGRAAEPRQHRSGRAPVSSPCKFFLLCV